MVLRDETTLEVLRRGQPESSWTDEMELTEPNMYNFTKVFGESHWMWFAPWQMPRAPVHCEECEEPAREIELHDFTPLKFPQKRGAIFSQGDVTPVEHSNVLWEGLDMCDADGSPLTFPQGTPEVA